MLMSQTLMTSNHRPHRQVLAIHPAQYLANIKSSKIKESLTALWDMPYDADPILEPEFVGLTHGQVIMSRQVQMAIQGDGGSVDRLLDRMIGKPEQVNKNLNLNASYRDFLDEVAKAEGQIDADGNVIDI